jgi:hypothetical protein
MVIRLSFLIVFAFSITLLIFSVTFLKLVTERSVLKSPSVVFLFGDIGFELRSLHLLDRMLYHLIHIPSPFCFGFFWDRVSHLCPGQPGHRPPPHYASHVAGMTGMHHHTKLFTDWNGVFWTFCPRCLQTTILPNSASQVTRIIGVSHCAQLTQWVLSTKYASLNKLV